MTKVTQIGLDDDGGASRRRIHLREISGDSESPLETVGQNLRAARLRRGDDLATVSRALKIRKDHLEAVEEDNFGNLPGKTYAIGFVRSYAQYLGLGVNETVERYKQEISGRREEHVPTDSNLHDDESRRLPQGWRIVAGIVGLALIYGVWHLLSAGTAPQAVPPAPAAGSSAVTPPAANQAAPTPPAPPKTAVVTPSQSATPIPAVLAINASGQGNVTVNANSRVVLHARTATRITIKGADGAIYANRDLSSGDSYDVPSVPGLSLAVADAGALNILVDGKDMGRVGQNSQVLGRVSLDPPSLVDRFNTR